MGLLMGVLVTSGTQAADQNKIFVIENFQHTQQQTQINGAAQAKVMQNLLRQAVRQEAVKLRRLSDAELKNQADQGSRVAQLVLADNFASEAHTRALTIAAANAALGDALQWYSDAASRGYPGTPAINKLLPAMPMRVVKGP